MDLVGPSIRLASESELDAIFAVDAVAKHSGQRQEFIRRSVAANCCYVAQVHQIVGYAVLDYSFYEQGFVSMLVVQAAWRRRGAGAALMQHLESVCRTGKLFTSTNLSNLPMQALLAGQGYKLSGVIHDLDEGDPELVFVKYLREGQGAEPHAG
jgi:N-acetylglutamate synthase-like GNAT family acetyltransferase